MKHFAFFREIDHPEFLIHESELLLKSALKKQAGKGKCIGLVFFQASTRTRLSTWKAAKMLGFEVVFIQVNQDTWSLETQDGACMDGGKTEHLKDFASMLGLYCDVIAVRAFPELNDRTRDREEIILRSIMQWSGVPVISMESSMEHPLQGLADALTIAALPVKRPKIVLSWVPHVKPVPHAVAHSFLQWTNLLDAELVITHPEGMELDSSYLGNAKVEYHQQKALEGADVVYAKSWASWSDYGAFNAKGASFYLDEQKMQHTNHAAFMHCLPLRRNVEVSDAVIDHPHSLVHQQAKNRIHSALLALQHVLD